MGDLLVPVTEAKARLAEIIRESDQRDVLLLRHGRPAAVVISADRYAALVDRIEDAEDRLAIYEHDRDEPTIGHDELLAQLGHSTDSSSVA